MYVVSAVTVDSPGNLLAGTVGRPETDTQISSLMFRPSVDGWSGSQGGRCELVLEYEGYRVGFTWKLALLHVRIFGKFCG